jgi:hypothetical protein
MFYMSMVDEHKVLAAEAEQSRSASHGPHAIMALVESIWAG